MAFTRSNVNACAMKTIYKISAILVVFLVFSCVNMKSLSAQQKYVNFDVFYDQLSPYGEWVDYPNYGYVWIPDVGRDFSPYSTEGYWVMTDYGWTWVSNYDWGWAPFHYGRWDYDDYYGWFWVPDNEWGPSWVTWRRANGYYGWTPLRPGISINLSFNDGYRDLDRWNFVRDRDFGRPDINRYYIDRNEYNTIIINSTVINNTYVDRRRNTTYIAGPTRDNVQKTSGRKINNITIRDNDKPGQALNNNQLKIYRPQIERINDRNQRPAPSKITNLKDVKPARERNATNQRNVATPVENNRREQQQAQPQQQKQQQVKQQKQQPQQQPSQQQKRQRQEQPQQQQQQQQPQQPQQQKRQRQEQSQQQQPQQQQQQQQVKQQQQRQNADNPSGNTKRERRQKAAGTTEKDKTN